MVTSSLYTALKQVTDIKVTVYVAGVKFSKAGLRKAQVTASVYVLMEICSKIRKVNLE